MYVCKHTHTHTSPDCWKLHQHHNSSPPPHFYLIPSIQTGSTEEWSIPSIDLYSCVPNRIPPLAHLIGVYFSTVHLLALIYQTSIETGADSVQKYHLTPMSTCDS